MSELVDREFQWDVEASLDTVWDALTTDEGLASWYVSAASVDAQAGGELKVDWGTGPYAMGTFDVFEPPMRLRLVYGESETGTEEWLLSHAGGVTHVRLIHSLPLEEGATWDDVYGDITRGWSLFMGTLQWVARTGNPLRRSSEVRTGPLGEGAWSRVLAALDLGETPPAGSTIDLAGIAAADVLLAVDGYGLLLGLSDHATLLVDVEGPSLYTLAATYGGDTPASVAVRSSLVSLAEKLCSSAA